jgi:hypothetical protein
MNVDSWAAAARSIARTAAVLYFAFIALFVGAHAVEGELPDLWYGPLAAQLDSMALLLILLGGIVGWKWEGTASVMVLLGSAIWLLVERNSPWPLGLSLLIGVLYGYGFAWWRTRRPSRQQGDIV